MSVRNRSNFNSTRRRSSGMGLLVQGMLFLCMIAFCFLMGFFVLSRYVPSGRGPDSPSPAASNGGDNETAASKKSKQLAESASPGAPVEHRLRRAPRPAARPADAPGPSIEPADDATTQKPSNIDDQPSDKPASSTEDADKPGADKSADKSAKDARSTEAPVVQEAGTTSPVDGGQPSSATPPRRKHRKRRHPQTAPTERKSGDDPQTTPREVTQPPVKLDDTSDAGGKGDGDN